MSADTTPTSVGPSLISAPAAWLAIVGSITVLTLLAALHALSPEFDPSFRMISEYALGDHPWVLSSMFAIWGISTWALALAIWTQPSTPSGRIGLWLLSAAGLGEILAATFDVTHNVGHGVAGLLGVVGLPVAAMLVSASLDHTGGWAATGRSLRRCCAHLTWIAVVLSVAAMAVMTIQFLHASGGQLPQHAPKVLPPGVLGLAGWANRLIVVANCAWVSIVAWQALATREGDERAVCMSA
jgi:Protein of unknown function (DUF998)